MVGDFVGCFAKKRHSRSETDFSPNCVTHSILAGEIGGSAEEEAADVVKLMFKEALIPANANRFLFLLAPVLTLTPALAAWAVIPFSDHMVLADIDAALLYVLALTSMGVYGVIIAGWASNSKYAFLGAMRSAAQIISYEIPAVMLLLIPVMIVGSLSMQDIVAAQATALVVGIMKADKGKKLKKLGKLIGDLYKRDSLPDMDKALGLKPGKAVAMANVAMDAAHGRKAE